MEATEEAREGKGPEGTRPVAKSRTGPCGPRDKGAAARRMGDGGKPHGKEDAPRGYAARDPSPGSRPR